MAKSIEDIDLERALADLEAVERELERRRRSRGMDYYCPNAMQQKAHCSPARLTLFCGGNRSGKSTFGAMELCYHLTRQYPDWYPKEKRFKGPIKAIISSTEYAVITRVIEPKIRQFLPVDYFKVKTTPQGYWSRMICKDGSTVDLLTLEQKDEAYESADWDFFWGDEPQSQRKYEAIQRGLVDRKGKGVITFTPLTEPWMKEMLVDKADGRKIELFQVDIRDNLLTINGDEILTEEAIKDFEESLPEDVKETRIHGKFFHLRGTVYREFSENHLVTCNHTQKDDNCIYHYRYPDPVICVLDPHDRLPHHLIWAYIDRQDDIYIDYELVVHLELDDLARKILSIEQVRGYKMKKRLIDPNFGRKPSSVGTNLTVIQELSRNGCPFYESNDNIELGHMLVRDMLHFNRFKPVTATNKPKLFFARDRVPVTIRSMRNLQYEDWQGKTKMERDLKEVEKDKENHGADCIRYLVSSRPTYKSFYEVKYEPVQAFY